MMSQKAKYIVAFKIAYGDRPDYGFFVGVLAQVITEHDPDCQMLARDLLAIFYDRIKSLGVEIFDEPWDAGMSKEV